MKNGFIKIVCLAAFLLSSNFAFAQSGGASGSNVLVWAIGAIVLLIALWVITQVADTLLNLEAKQSGADKSGANFSLFPRWNEIFAPKLPNYVGNAPVTVLSEGHDILLVGEAEKQIDDANISLFAVQPPNFIGISPIPKVMVEAGASVQAGEPLFFDKKNPEIIHVAPVSGEVVSITRGAKRAIASIVIKADATQTYKQHTVPSLDVPREKMVAFLKESGAWSLFRQRPYNVLADADVIPNNIFISTFDSAPLAPDLNLVVAGKEAAFQKGLDVLNTLTSGKVHLGLNAKGDTCPSDAFVNATGVEKNYFHGKHPAGNVGVQIHHTAPIGAGMTVWTLGVQEVITLGNLFLNGQYNAERVVAVTGMDLAQPKYVRTKLGANIGELLKGNVNGENLRFVSGDVLSGTQKSGDEFLNFYDDQVTVLEEGDYNEPFGWLLPITPRPSISGTFPNGLFPEHRFDLDTNTHGERRAFVVTGQYESMLPMDVYPQHLMKSILVSDFEKIEGLGIYELVEEDVALCEFACTSKQPLQKILREGIEFMQEQG